MVTSDFNATVVAVDETMSAYENYYAELADVSARIRFESESVFSAVADALADCERRIEQIESELEYLYTSDVNEVDSQRFTDECERLREELGKIRKKQSRLELLNNKCCRAGRAMCEDFFKESGMASRICSEAIAFMGKYIHDLNLVSEVKDGVYCSKNVYVCVLDSSRYPETAEHMRVANMRGKPSTVTIDRAGAAARREASLRDTGTRSEFDRDEVPMAMFKEGGDGADVFYLDPADNRGAGAYISHQLRFLPDGTRVKIRVV